MRNNVNEEKKEEYRKLREYEEGLRIEVEKTLKLKIPSVPENVDPLVEILFLERLLAVNGFRKVANAYNERNKKAVKL